MKGSPYPFQQGHASNTNSAGTICAVGGLNAILIFKLLRMHAHAPTHCMPRYHRNPTFYCKATENLQRCLSTRLRSYAGNHDSSTTDSSPPLTGLAVQGLLGPARRTKHVSNSHLRLFSMYIFIMLSTIGLTVL